MILVILGTQDKSFTRLLKAVDNCLQEGVIQDEVIVQAGYTSYHSDRMKIFDLIPMKEFDQLIKKADLIITHGGVGSIMSGLRAKKKIIAVSRLSKYGEHTNDHQCQIIKEFVQQGYILECTDLEHLDNTIRECKTFTPRVYQSNNSKMLKIINDFIENG